MTQPTAALLVEVFPLGKGWIQLLVRSVGPEPLSLAEQVRVLRQAADSIAERQESS